MQSVAGTQDAHAAGGVAASDLQQIRGRVMGLAGPAVAELFLQTFTGIVNMIMVGSLGATAITAVGLTNQPVFMMLAVFASLSVGTTALVARSVGAGDREQARVVARQSLVATFFLGLVMAAPQIIYSRAILVWMGAAPDVIEPATRYMQIIVGGTVFTVIPLAAAGILRGAGDSRTPMTLNILMNILNASFGFLLIYGHLGLPRLGVVGAGIGTVAARFVSSVLFVRLLYSKRCVVALKWTDSHKPDISVIRRIMRIGVPSALEQFVMRGGQTVFARTVASLGTVAYAAHQLTLNAESLAFNPPMGFQVASTTLVGQYLGAEQPDTAERAGYEAAKMSLGTMVIVGTICYVFARQIMSIYTSDLRVIEMAVPNMRLFSMALPGMAMHFVLVGALRGAGDTKWPLYVSSTCTWVVRVGLAQLLIGRGMGLRGAWLAMVVDHCVRASLTFFRYRSGAWKKTRV